MSAQTFGIDVSSAQGYGLPTGAIGDFVMVKATEGTSYTNPFYAGQLAAARKRAATVGHYLFLHGAAVSAQVNHFLSVVKWQPGDLLAVDWEAVPATDGGDTATCAQKDQALRLVKAAHPQARVLLYENGDFLTHHDTSRYHGDGLWFADPSHPAGHPALPAGVGWVLHQFGQAAGVDRNCYAGTVEQLRAWAAAPKPKPQPAPKPKAPRTYTVRKGDTLTGIAKAHGVGLAALEKANPKVKNPNVIYAGQVLNLP